MLKTEDTKLHVTETGDTKLHVTEIVDVSFIQRPSYTDQEHTATCQSRTHLATDTMSAIVASSGGASTKYGTQILNRNL